MATSSYYKAAEWVKRVNPARIESLEWLENCTIRQLRAIADKINHQDKGWVFCTATLGKALGRHTKQELASVIWEFVSLKRSAPKVSKWFEVDECGNVRIVSQRPGADASPWTVSIGYDNYKDAEVLQKYLHKNGCCNASVVRLAKHCLEFKYELKIWLLNEVVLKKLISKEQARIRQERQQEIKTWYEQLEIVARLNNCTIHNVNFVLQSARIYKDKNLIGLVGVGLTNFYYNERPNSAVSRNMPVESIGEAVEKLVRVQQRVS